MIFLRSKFFDKKKVKKPYDIDLTKDLDMDLDNPYEIVDRYINLDRFKNEFFKEPQKNGNRLRALRICFEVLKRIKMKFQTDPLSVLERSARFLNPKIMPSSVKLGGMKYKVPVIIRPRRANLMVREWLFKNTLKPKWSKKFLIENWTKNIYLAYYFKGPAYARKKKVYEDLLSNRGLIKYLK